jgi:regulator of cell morphogenesis and NO signaling
MWDCMVAAISSPSLRQRKDVHQRGTYGCEKGATDASGGRHMAITPETTVARNAPDAPATLRVFKQHPNDFCCGGKTPHREVCAREALDLDTLMAELEAATAGLGDSRNWQEAPLADLVAHIQSRYHQHLYEELPRLSAMMSKVLERHGDRLPETLPPLAAAFDVLQQDLLHHMRREDAVLFPAILSLAAGSSDIGGPSGLSNAIAVMERDHAQAGDALDRLRTLTHGYQPPDDACPTFRGLYFGLAELEKDMHVHVHLENHVLFPRALTLNPAPAGP